MARADAPAPLPGLTRSCLGTQQLLPSPSLPSFWPGPVLGHVIQSLQTLYAGPLVQQADPAPDNDPAGHWILGCYHYS